MISPLFWCNRNSDDWEYIENKNNLVTKEFSKTNFWKVLKKCDSYGVCVQVVFCEQCISRWAHASAQSDSDLCFFKDNLRKGLSTCVDSHKIAWTLWYSLTLFINYNFPSLFSKVANFRDSKVCDKKNKKTLLENLWLLYMYFHLHLHLLRF